MSKKTSQERERRSHINEFLFSLDIHHVNNFENAVLEAFGNDQGQDYLDKIDRLFQADDDSQEVCYATDTNQLYELYCSDLRLQRLVRGYWDFNLLQSTMAWILDHEMFFGKKILDVGCSDGVLTCFLAKLFPDSVVVGIDRSANAIHCAEDNKETLSLDNVEFVCSSLEEYGEANFNTVFSSRTVHENIQEKDITDTDFETFSRQLEIFKEVYGPYTTLLTDHLSDGGTLVTIERMDPKAVSYYGFLNAMNEQSVGIECGINRELKARECNDKQLSVFTVTVGRKGEVRTPDELFTFWSGYAFTDTSEPMNFTRAQADHYVEQISAGVRYGFNTYQIRDGEKKQIGRHVIYSMKNHPEALLLYESNIYQCRLGAFENFCEEDEKEYLLEIRRDDEGSGFVVEDIPEGAVY